MKIPDEIAKIELDALIQRHKEVKTTIASDIDWLRYRIIIHPDLLDAIDRLSRTPFPNLSTTTHPSGVVIKSISALLLVRDPNVEGWLLIDTSATG